MLPQNIRPYASLILVATLIFALFSCKSAPEERTVASSITAPVVASLPTACTLPAYDFMRIGVKQRLSSEDVQRMLRRTSQLPSFFKAYSQYTDLLVLDTLRCQDYTLMSVLWRHEDCCEDLYYLTMAPNGSMVLDSARIAGRGMDGQWHAEASMRLTVDGELHVTELEENDTDAENEPNVLDSTVTAYVITPQGRFVKKQLSSVQRNLRLGEHISLQKE